MRTDHRKLVLEIRMAQSQHDNVLALVQHFRCPSITVANNYSPGGPSVSITGTQYPLRDLRVEKDGIYLRQKLPERSEGLEGDTMVPHICLMVYPDLVLVGWLVYSPTGTELLLRWFRDKLLAWRYNQRQGADPIEVQIYDAVVGRGGPPVQANLFDHILQLGQGYKLVFTDTFAAYQPTDPMGRPTNDHPASTGAAALASATSDRLVILDKMPKWKASGYMLYPGTSHAHARRLVAQTPKFEYQDTASRQTETKEALETVMLAARRARIVRIAELLIEVEAWKRTSSKFMALPPDQRFLGTVGTMYHGPQSFKVEGLRTWAASSRGQEMQSITPSRNPEPLYPQIRFNAALRGQTRGHPTHGWVFADIFAWSQEQANKSAKGTPNGVVVHTGTAILNRTEDTWYRDFPTSHGSVSRRDAHHAMRSVVKINESNPQAYLGWAIVFQKTFC
jgi:hypothetical protein